jgi:hypothetical protein
MSDAPPTQVMPLFYNKVVGVNPSQQRGLRLDRSTGYGFTANAQSVPLGLGEIEAASQHYPVLFTAGPNPLPVALLGLADSSNLFLEADGRSWRAGTYIPAYVRAFPFIFVEDAASKTVYVGMEEDAACLRHEGGDALFEDDKPTSALNDAIAFCSAFRDNLAAAAAFGRALDEAGLLQEEEATINFTTGASTRIRGFKILVSDRLAQLSDEVFLDWRRRGWLAPIYAHVLSAGRWGRLIELAAARAQPPA